MMSEPYANEWHLHGTPGSGKTSSLAAQARRWGEEFGFNNILLASYTRSAAAEIAGRGLPLRKDQVGTLHGFAFRALGLNSDDVAETYLAEFNEAYPGYRLTDEDSEALDEPTADRNGATDADMLHSNVEILRARRLPLDEWPKSEAKFFACWSDWCKQSGYVDFTGMIEAALENCPTAPGDPAIAFYDETQDSTALELELIRKWGTSMQRILLSYDSDQNLYQWRGAVPEALLDTPLAEGRKRVLGQSYRVPNVVHTVAQRWIARLSRREPKECWPRRDADGAPVEGVMRCLDGTGYASPELLVADAWKQVEAGRTVMILAACSYMLDPVKKELKAQAVPFGNPWRRKRGDWNPLISGMSNRRYAVDRLLAYLRPQVDVWGDDARWYRWADVADWIDPMRQAGLLQHGMKTEVKHRIPSEEADYVELLDRIFDLDDDGMAAIERGDLDFFAEHLLPARANPYRFPIDIARVRGGAILREQPKVTLGTIHCSPPDEPILTATRGWVPIGELTQDDGLIGYNRQCNRFARDGGRTKGFEFERSERPFTGELIVMQTPLSRTRVTPNHRVLARWNEELFCDRWSVYLMRRGPWWRVGICTTARRPYRSGGLNGRLATEGADDGWILHVCDTKNEARVLEAIVQGQFGIPGLTFRTSDQRSLSDDDLARVHDALIGAVDPRAKTLLDAYGLLVDEPLYTRSPLLGERVGQYGTRMDGIAKRNMRATFTTAAANLVPLTGRVTLPTYENRITDARNYRAPGWSVAEVERTPYNGPVFGLDLPPYHHYVSGGVVVHNSSKGAESDVVYLINDLSQSGETEWMAGGQRKDAVVRQFYVAMTRAREELVLCEESTRRYLSREMWLRAAKAA